MVTASSFAQDVVEMSKRENSELDHYKLQRNAGSHENRAANLYSRLFRARSVRNYPVDRGVDG